MDAGGNQLFPTRPVATATTRVPGHRTPVLLEVRQISYFARAIADFVDRDTHSVKHGHEKIRHRGFGGVLYVAAWFKSSAAAAGQHGRKIFVQVAVAITEAAAVDDHGMIEQGSVAVLSRFQLREEVGELVDVEAVDLRYLLDFVLVSLVVSQSVVSFCDTYFAIRACALLGGHQHCCNASHVCLKSDGHQIEHE